MFDELVRRIDQLLATPPVVVAVSGFGGSGKTTLAERLRAHYSPRATLVQLDDFLVNHGEGHGINGGYDWERFVAVVHDAKQGRPLHYQPYDWDADALAGFIDEPPRSLVILEGVRLLQPSVTDNVDFTVWINCSSEEATRRGIARDRSSQSWDETAFAEHVRKWHDVWAPKDEDFADAFAPRETADILYELS